MIRREVDRVVFESRTRGRGLTYSGKEVEWSKALGSKIELLPETLSFDAKPKVLPGPDGNYQRAIPGQTEVL